MLAALSLAVLLVESPRPATSGSQRTSCPATPFDTFTPSAKTCDAIEVTGRVDAASVSLDPAFDTRVSELEMARPAPGECSLVAYNRDGQTVFTFPFSASGAFRLVIPLSAQAAASITRLTLSSNGATFERSASLGDAPSAEAIASDDGHVIFIWNAQAYPAIRIANARDGSAIATASGTQTFEQIGVETAAGRFVVSFSDGVRSVTRTVAILGR